MQLVEPTRSSVTNTIDQQRIQNLPINQRDATGFALTLSTVGRDNGRPIGPAPTSGLNIGGQRGRSTQVNVDGADFTDNSINAARTTVSMEAVQEYQVATNSYTPEFGRATGGVINVVTKARHQQRQRQCFWLYPRQEYPGTQCVRADREARVSSYAVGRHDWRTACKGPGVSLSAPSERRQRDESGFFTSDVVGPLTSSATIGVIPGLNPVARTFTGLTAQQAAVINALVASGNPNNICAARAYAFFASSGALTGLTGTNSLTSPNDGSGCPAISPIGPGAVGSRFLLAVLRCLSRISRFVR